MRVLIFGVTGQDGSFLADRYVAQGAEVFGVYRKTSAPNFRNILPLLSDEVKNFNLIKGDVLDHSSVFRIIHDTQADLIFNEADQDHVAWSYAIPGYSIQTTTTAVANMLEAIKTCSPKAKFFQPVSSNMFGRVLQVPQKEETAHNPVSPYGIAKSATFHLCRYYRDSYHLNISTGIFYNHESERRTSEYLSRKVTLAVSRIDAGIQKTLELGDLTGYVDWGCAREYMDIASKINESGLCDDFIVGTGVLTKVEDFVANVFSMRNLDYRKYVRKNDKLARPIPTGQLQACTEKLNLKLGVTPKVTLQELTKRMLDYDCKNVLIKN